MVGLSGLYDHFEASYGPKTSLVGGGAHRPGIAAGGEGGGSPP